MKKNKLTKGLIYSVSSILIAIIVFLVISYFGKEESVQKNELSKNDKKQEQVSYQKDTKDEMENAKEEQKLESKNTEPLENKAKPKGQKDLVIGNKDNNKVSKTSGIQANDGKKLSESEKDRTIGRVFNSQKEALDFGKKEVKRLVDKDKKPRQFAISKVVSENGSLKGWTVDIFEDNNIEKIVSNSGLIVEEDKE
ncbi:sarcalumenin [uncultured Gemella sp.]|uniref:sarcalumenin n=1 Tax=uncultured Gemella sp. TaxID=254352 RepID=UPI0028D10535|nr:sarcalumenin [uncultured Gemella sp.]